jgi:hypothetical protein
LQLSARQLAWLRLFSPVIAKQADT